MDRIAVAVELLVYQCETLCKVVAAAAKQVTEFGEVDTAATAEPKETEPFSTRQKRRKHQRGHPVETQFGVNEMLNHQMGWTKSMHAALWGALTKDPGFTWGQAAVICGRTPKACCEESRRMWPKLAEGRAWE